MKPYTKTLYATLLEVKHTLKKKKHLTDDQAAKLKAIQAELDARDQAAQRRQDAAKLSAAWDRYFYDRTA